MLLKLIAINAPTMITLLPVDTSVNILLLKWIYIKSHLDINSKI